MSESKHTPGPWDVLNDLASGHLVPIDAQNGRHVALAFTNPPYDEHEANARLIASAPELLAAAKRALKTIEELPPRVNEDRYEPLMQLSAAIARAERGSK